MADINTKEEKQESKNEEILKNLSEIQKKAQQELLDYTAAAERYRAVMD